MIQLLSLFTVLFFLSACDVKHPPEDIDLDTIYDSLPAYTQTNSYPYSSNDFQYVLDNAQYQAPDGTISIIDSNLSSEYFYLDNSGNLIFALNKKPNTSRVSSQLIQTEIWNTSDEEGNYFISMLSCLKPKDINAYTWMQVHGLGESDANSTIYYNYPLLKLTWERNMKNEYDHIWAVLTKSSPGENEPKIYEWIDLGARPNNLFSAEVHIAHNIMEIKINYSTISIQNVSYWENVPSYFKVGIAIESYLDGGSAGVSFNKLRFENNASNVENITHF